MDSARMQAHRCFPHARGDGPYWHINAFGNASFSPRPWGWSARDVVSQFGFGVFPTPVGMVRRDDIERINANRFPHARGDGP